MRPLGNLHRHSSLQSEGCPTRENVVFQLGHFILGVSGSSLNPTKRERINPKCCVAWPGTLARRYMEHGENKAQLERNRLQLQLGTNVQRAKRQNPELPVISGYKT